MHTKQTERHHVSEMCKIINKETGKNWFTKNVSKNCEKTNRYQVTTSKGETLKR